MSILQPAQSYKVVVYAPGAFVSSDSTSATINVNRGHGFRVADAYLSNPITDNAHSGSNVVASVTATTVVMTNSVTVVAGDVLFNLGPDTATKPAGFTSSPIKLFTDADYTTTISNATVTTNSQGEYNYFYKGDGRVWELVLDTGSVPVDYVLGYGTGDSSFNVHDFGVTGAASGRDDKAFAAAVLALPAKGGKVKAPAGDYYFGAAVAIDQSNVTIEGEEGTKLLMDVIDSAFFNVNLAQVAGADVDNITFKNLSLWDDDPATHASAAASQGIMFEYCNTGLVENCYFYQQGDESVSVAKYSTDVKITNNTFEDGCHQAEFSGCVFISDSKRCLVSNNAFTGIQNGAAVRLDGVTTAVAGDSDTEDHVIDGNTFFNLQDTQAFGRQSGSGVLVIGVVAQVMRNITISNNAFRTTGRMAVVVNPATLTTVENVVITGNTIYGGGTLGVSAPRGAIDLSGTETATISRGTISNNIIDGWGTGADNKHGIYLLLSDFSVTGNLINNVGEAGIYSGGAGDTGNVIANNIISECGDTSTGAGIGIYASFRDLVVGNVIHDIDSPNTENAYGIKSIDGDDGSDVAEVLMVANRISTVKEDTGAALGYGMQVYKNSIGALNFVRDCNVGVFMEDEATANAPSALDNILDANTTDLTNSATTARANIIHRVEHGAGSGHVTEASGTAAIAQGAATVVVTHGVNDFRTTGYDIQITPTMDWLNAGTTPTQTVFWVDTFTSTQFTINLDNASPGDAGDIDFNWSIIKRQQS